MLSFDRFQFDREQRRLLSDGVDLNLRPQVAEVLDQLLLAHPKPASKERLIETVWAGAFVSDQSIALCISELRKALGDDSRNPTYIRTLSKRGYQWIYPLDSDDTIASTIQVSVTPDTRRSKIGMLLVLATVFIIAAVLWVRIAGPREHRDAAAEIQESTNSEHLRVAVMPFQNGTDEVELDWICYGLAEMVRDNCDQSSSIQTVAFKDIRAAEELDRLPPLASLGGSDAQAWLEFLRCDYLVATHVSKVESGFVFNSTIISQQGSRSERELFAPNLLDGGSRLAEVLLGRFAPIQPVLEFIDQYTDDPFLNLTYATGLHKTALEGPSAGLPYFETCISERESFVLARYHLAHNLRLLGEALRAQQELDRVLEQTTGDLSLVRARALGLKSVLLFDQFDLDGSTELVLQAQTMFQQLGAELDAAIATGQLGYLDYARNEFSAAIEKLEACLKVVRQHGDRLTEANVLNNIGMVIWATDDVDGAMAKYQAALLIYQTYGSKPGVALMTGNMGATALQVGFLDQARDQLGRGLDLYRELGHNEGLCRMLLNMMILKAADQDLNSAISFGQEGSKVAHELKIGFMEAQFLFTLIRLLADAGRFEELETLAANQEQMVRDLNYPDLWDQFCGARAYAAQKRGRADRAQKYMDMTSRAYRDEHYLGLYTRALMELARPNPERAQKYMKQAVELAPQGWKSHFRAYVELIEAAQSQPSPEFPKVGIVAYN